MNEITKLIETLSHDDLKVTVLKFMSGINDETTINKLKILLSVAGTIKNGTDVKVIDPEFVEASNETIGTVIDSTWLKLPSNLYGLSKIHVYNVRMKKTGMTVLFPIESLIIL